MLTTTEIEAFMADGFVAVREAVPEMTAQACADVVWSELAARGIDRTDSATWTEPVVRVGCPEGGAFAQAGTAARLQEACDQLLGEGRWWRREGVGGSIPIRFPSTADPGDAGWHLDGGAPDADGRTRVTIRVSRLLRSTPCDASLGCWAAATSARVED